MKKKLFIIIFILIITTIIGILGIKGAQTNKKLKTLNTDETKISYVYETDEGEVKGTLDDWVNGYILNVEKSICNGQQNPEGLAWDVENNSIILTLKATNKCTLYFVKWQHTFNYSGNVQTIEVPKTGIYLLEVWGAQGGTSEDFADEGKGGYSSGTISLNAKEKLYVVVGGQGSSTDENGLYKGGYNGGGDGALGTGQYAYGGGGATHIAKSDGLLSTFANKKDDLLIVAGGGGGNGAITERLASIGGARNKWSKWARYQPSNIWWQWRYTKRSRRLCCLRIEW